MERDFFSSRKRENVLWGGGGDMNHVVIEMVSPRSFACL